LRYRTDDGINLRYFVLTAIVCQDFFIPLPPSGIAKAFRNRVKNRIFAGDFTTNIRLNPFPRKKI
jgi:hypothetical protein